MSGPFAREFERIFREIFGPLPGEPARSVRPHLRRDAGAWRCSCAAGYVGWGVSPRQAYGGWLAVQGRVSELSGPAAYHRNNVKGQAHG